MMRHNAGQTNQKRRYARELAVKALFALEVEKGDPYRQLDYISQDSEMAGFDEGTPESQVEYLQDDYARRLIAAVLTHLPELDGIIRAYSQEWDIERLGGAERNILRLGLCEMLYEDRLPPAIAINEAVDLVKKYATPESAKYVNGILGRKAEEMKTDKPKEFSC